MLRFFRWILLGGILLIAIVILVPLIGTAAYLRSPDRVLGIALLKLVDAGSLHINILGETPEPDGLSFTADGSVDKRSLIQPRGTFNFSFQNGQSFYGNGEARLAGGQAYVRMAQIAGIPNVLPGALQSIWTGADIRALISLAESKIVPSVHASFTNDDMDALLSILKKDMPIVPADQGKKETVDGAKTIHYSAAFDPERLSLLLSDLDGALQGTVSQEDADAIREWAKSATGTVMEFWVEPGKGTLYAARIVLPKTGTAEPLHVSIRFSAYDQAVAVETPLDARPLSELLSRLFGPGLGRSGKGLPFAVPFLSSSDSVPTSGAGEKTASTERDSDQDGLSDISELFYGSDPYNPDTNGDGVPDGVSVDRGVNPKNGQSLFGFGIR